MIVNNIQHNQSKPTTLTTNNYNQTLSIIFKNNLKKLEYNQSNTKTCQNIRDLDKMQIFPKQSKTKQNTQTQTNQHQIQLGQHNKHTQSTPINWTSTTINELLALRWIWLNVFDWYLCVWVWWNFVRWLLLILLMCCRLLFICACSLVRLVECKVGWHRWILSGVCVRT